MKQISAILFLIISMTAMAEPQKLEKLTTRDGREYHAVTIVSHDAVGIKINHAGGVGRIGFERLPIELQKKYQFDFTKAEEQKKREQQIAIATEQAIARELENKSTTSSDLSEKFDTNELSIAKIDGYINMMQLKISDAQTRRHNLMHNAQIERSRTRTIYRNSYDSYGNRYSNPEIVPDKAGYAKARQYEKEAMALLDSISQAKQLIAAAEMRKKFLSQPAAK
jgi:hypothetical protein